LNRLVDLDAILYGSDDIESDLLGRPEQVRSGLGWPGQSTTGQAVTEQGRASQEREVQGR
jgi:hypothetical protein